MRRLQRRRGESGVNASRERWMDRPIDRPGRNSICAIDTTARTFPPRIGRLAWRPIYRIYGQPVPRTRDDVCSSLLPRFRRDGLDQPSRGHLERVYGPPRRRGLDQVRRRLQGVEAGGGHGISNLRLRPKAEPPWLMFPADDGDTPQHLAMAGVFSLTDGRRRSITLPAPPIQTRVWIGSANGWVVTADGECELHLLNPISGVQRPLPSVTTTGYFDALPITDGGKARFLWNVASFRDTHRHEGYSVLPGTRPFVEMSAEEIQSSRLLKAVPLFDPSSGKYSIMMMHNPQNKLVFAREGDPKWVPLRAQHRYEDVIVYHGRFCTVTMEGLVQTWEHDASTMTFNPKGIAPQHIEPEEDGIPLYFKKYLAKSPDGNLILIWREHYSERCDESDSEDDVSIERDEDEDDYNISCCCEEIEELEPDPTIRFQAFVLDEHPIGSEWREVHDFGGASIFIGCA